MVNRPKIVSAIDIGSSKITTLIAQISSEEEKFNIIGAASIPSVGLRKGQIVNIEEASKAIVQSVEAAERMAGYSISRALVSVGGAHISSQNSHGIVAVADPEGEIIQEDVRRVIEAAKAVSIPSSREILHVIPRTYTVDSQEGVADPIGMSGVRLEVETHIVTGSTTSIRNLTKCVAEVGTEIESLVFSGIAAAEAILTQTEKELGVVLVDVGGGTINIAVYVEGSPVYTSVLPIGARNVTNDLAIGLRLSLESSEKLKLFLSNKEKPPPPFEERKEILEERKMPEVKESDEIDLSVLGIEEAKTVSRKTVVEGIIRPRLNEIFAMVGAEIQRSGFAGLTPAGIVLCGGGAMSIGAIDVCKKTLSLPVRVGYPGRVTGLIDDVMTPAFATSVGLILYAANANYYQNSKFSLPGVKQLVGRIQIKGVFGKVAEIVKSFLP